MKKGDFLIKRREYIKNELDKSQNISGKARELAERLFLSERTIWRDYQES